MSLLPDQLWVQVRDATWGHLKSYPRGPPGGAKTAQQREAEDRTRFLEAHSGLKMFALAVSDQKNHGDSLKGPGRSGG